MNMNKQENIEPVAEIASEKPTVTEVAKMDVQCHILITDADTGEVLVNQRG